MHMDMRVLELLASKLCHDLVSPVSAINNGVELIEDVGGSVVGEAMKLIGDSAENASKRLRLFRIAYGRAGSEENLAVRDVRGIVEQYLSGGKVSINWPEGVPAEDFAGRKGVLKTIVNMVVTGEENLAYGGVITLKIAEGEGDAGCVVEVSGRGAALSPAFQSAFEGVAEIEDLTPRTIQPYVTHKMAENFGLKLSHSQEDDDSVRFVLCGAPQSEIEYDGSQSA